MNNTFIQDALHQHGNGRNIENFIQLKIKKTYNANMSVNALAAYLNVEVNEYIQDKLPVGQIRCITAYVGAVSPFTLSLRLIYKDDGHNPYQAWIELDPRFSNAIFKTTGANHGN